MNIDIEVILAQENKKYKTITRFDIESATGRAGE